MHWDVAYYAERQRSELFQFSDHELKQYFPLKTVLKGLFDLCEEMFSIKVIKQPISTIQVWHPDVEYFMNESLRLITKYSY